MPKITFDNGKSVFFEKQPTDADIEEVYAEISKQDKPKPMFSSIEEANAGLRNAKIDQRIAEMNTVGPMPYISAFDKAVKGTAPFVFGGGVGTNLAKMAGGSILRQAAAGAGSGIASGLATDYNNPKDILGNVVGQSITGAVAGGGLTAAGKLIGSGFNAGKRIVDSFKGPSSADLKDQLVQAKELMLKQKETLTDLFNNKSKDVISIGKKVVPEISKNMTTAYGDVIESIFKKIDDPVQLNSVLKKNASPINNKELVSGLENLVNSAAKDPLIVKSPAYSQVVKMLDYYKNGLESTSTILDETGNVIKSISKAPESVDIKNLISQVRQVRDTISKADAPIAAKDYFATKFNSFVGNLLKDRIEGFKELQSTYSTMANTRKVAYKIFKPLSDESSAESFLNRIKNNTLKPSDEKLVKFIESGGKIGNKEIPGAGNIFNDIKDIGSKLKDMKSNKEIRDLAIKLSKKASDEAFRNSALTWAAAAAGAGTTTIAAGKLLTKNN